MAPRYLLHSLLRTFKAENIVCEPRQRARPEAPRPCLEGGRTTPAATERVARLPDPVSTPWTRSAPLAYPRAPGGGKAALDTTYIS